MRCAAFLAGDAFGIAREKDRLAVILTLHALIDARQKATGPDRLAGIGIFAATGQHDEAGQILVIRAQPVIHPRADAWTAFELAAGLEHQLRGRVIELLGPHAFDETEFVNHPTRFGICSETHAPD